MDFREIKRSLDIDKSCIAVELFTRKNNFLIKKYDKEGECPVEAISMNDGVASIDADKCIECGACAGACPVEAPVEG